MNHSASHILVVDDNEMNRDLLSRRLRRKGFEVSVAVDGVDALAKLDDHPVDLILLDIMMPRMNGMEMLAEVRKTRGPTELPIIMATAKSDSETVVSALKAGANDYVTKPIDFEVVMARVETQLDLGRQTQNDRRGGFSRLTESGQHRALESRHFCPRCRSSIQGHPSACGFCKSARPGGGWPQVGAEKFGHLGRTIGDRYFLNRFIGAGSVGTVYQARDLELNREYAAKVVSLGDPEIGVDPGELRERTTREVEVLSKLSNPHVVKIYDVVVIEDDVYALLLDFVRGYSLSKILERAGRLSISHALDIARQIAQGLYEAHQLGIVHCDIKPENIMLEKLPIRGYFAHILDFGVAEILEFKPEQHVYSGTPFYSAPEQFESPEKLDHRADIYSLGAVLFHMLDGRPPFEGKNAFDVLKKHITAPLPRLSSIDRQEMDSEFLDDLLRRMMAKDPNDRFPDLSGFLRYTDTLVRLFEARNLEREREL